MLCGGALQCTAGRPSPSPPPQWLQGTDHAGAHLRALGRLGDVTRAACHWTADHHRSGVGLAVLQHVVADPLNRHHVRRAPGEEGMVAGRGPLFSSGRWR